MGTTKTTTGSQGTSSQTTTPTPSAAELRLQDIQLGDVEATTEQRRRSNEYGYNLLNQLLQGLDLPGYLKDLPGGISEDVTQSIVNQSLKDIQPMFQSSGLLDSGVRASISARTAADIRRAAAETNLNSKFNLLNLAVGAPAQIQQPQLASASMLSERLAGLRTINQTGQFNNTGFQNTGYSFFTSPFTTSLAGGLSQGLGAAAGAALLGCWVASEIFGGWLESRTILARIYVNKIAPKWFKKLYLEFGERIAKFISNKPFFKLLLRPLFEAFARRAENARITD